MQGYGVSIFFPGQSYLFFSLVSNLASLSGLCYNELPKKIILKGYSSWLIGKNWEPFFLN